MDPELERALRGLEDAAEFANTYRFELTDDYLTLIAKVEGLPSNQSGTDKSGRWLGDPAYKGSTERARLVEPPT
jgi:hypothetical protein